MKRYDLFEEQLSQTSERFIGESEHSKQSKHFPQAASCFHQSLTKLTERVLKTQMLQYFLLTIRGGSMGNRLKQSSLKNTNTMLQFVVCFLQSAEFL